MIAKNIPPSNDHERNAKSIHAANPGNAKSFGGEVKADT